MPQQDFIKKKLESEKETEIFFTLSGRIIEIAIEICTISSKYDHLSETIVDIRDAKWFIHIRLPLYPSISITQ